MGIRSKGLSLKALVRGRNLELSENFQLTPAEAEKKWKCLVTQLCPTLWDPTDCSLPGSSVHGILQARVLEWVAIPFSKGSS